MLTELNLSHCVEEVMDIYLSVGTLCYSAVSYRLLAELLVKVTYINHPLTA